MITALTTDAVAAWRAPIDTKNQVQLIVGFRPTLKRQK